MNYVFMSATRLGDEVELCRQTVYLHSKALEEAGFFKMYKAKYQTNVYVMDPALRDPYVRHRLSRYFDAFKGIALACLLSASLTSCNNQYLKPKLTLLNNKTLIFLRYRIRESYTKGDCPIHGPPTSKKSSKGEEERKALSFARSDAKMISHNPLDPVKAELVAWLKPTTKLLIQLEKYEREAVAYASIKLKRDLASGKIYNEKQLMLFKYAYEYMRSKGLFCYEDVTSILENAYQPTGAWFQENKTPALSINVSQTFRDALQAKKKYSEILPDTFTHNLVPLGKSERQRQFDAVYPKKNPQEGSFNNQQQGKALSTAEKREKERDMYKKLSMKLSYPERLDRAEEIQKAVEKSKADGKFNPFMAILSGEHRCPQ